MEDKSICPFLEIMSFLSKKWILLIIQSISEWCMSYTDIEKNLTWVNPRILSNRLKELQELWFVEKKIISETPLKAIYCLTKKWDSLSKQVESLSDWARKNLDK